MTDDSASPGTGPKAGEVASAGNRYSVTLRVDGQAIPLKLFLHDLLGGAVTGLLEGLHNVPSDPSQVVIEVRRP